MEEDVVELLLRCSLFLPPATPCAKISINFYKSNFSVLGLSRYTFKHAPARSPGAASIYITLKGHVCDMLITAQYCLLIIGPLNCELRYHVSLPPTLSPLLSANIDDNCRNSQRTSEKQFSPSMLDIVRVGGRFRVGKLLGSGGSGELNSRGRDSESTSFSESRYLGSVYQGEDFLTGADVALKIGYSCSSPSRLGHEYHVYSEIAGSKGIPKVHWYGKEGEYEVIVLDHLGTSLGDQVDQLEFDRRKIFSYATQMVCFVM
jgi:hypothetical protein